jgi:hypothetical protein
MNRTMRLADGEDGIQAGPLSVAAGCRRPARADILPPRVNVVTGEMMLIDCDAGWGSR